MNMALQSSAKPVSTPALVSIPNQKTLQAKLSISAPNDEYEREADRAAEYVTAGFDFSKVRINTDAPGFRLQREQGAPESSNEPLIPIPVFDQFDPAIIVPDIEGIPGFLRGRQVPLSTLRKVLDAIRGELPALSPGRDFCSTLLPGYETAQSGELTGLCCPGSRRDREVCCRPQDIGLMSFRCCTNDEVIVNGRCVRPQRAPVQVAPPVPALPPIPRLELQMPRIRFGTVQSESIDHFTLNESSLPSGASEKLDRLASQLNLYREVEVHIDGHTDSSYTPEYNQRLSEQRAQAVRDALMQRGIEASRLIVTGYGENQLLFPQERTQEEKARNRRVDVWFYIPPSTGDMMLMRQPQTSVPSSSPSPEGQGSGQSASAATPELPSAAFVRFVTSGRVRCCRAAGPKGCPSHLGAAQPGDPRPKNGMNLVAAVTGHRPGIEYGFVQVIHMQQCVRFSAAIGGGWGTSDSRSPGSDDSPIPEATCQIPDAQNEITMTDAPGFSIALGSAELPDAEETTQRMNATNWVIAREPRQPWRRISELFRWHSVTAIRRNTAGNWELTPRANRIGEGYTNVGGCPPPSG